MALPITLALFIIAGTDLSVIDSPDVVVGQRCDLDNGLSVPIQTSCTGVLIPTLAMLRGGGH